MTVNGGINYDYRYTIHHNKLWVLELVYYILAEVPGCCPVYSGRLPELGLEL